MSELISYHNILKDIKNFKKAGSRYGDDFNLYDTPSNKYFKILFYFGSAPEEYEENYMSGLLAPTWELYNNDDNNASNIPYYAYNSAWAYLKLNDENERAEKLEHFVTLLSDINTRSPWYFSKIGGLQEALERKVAEDGKMEMTDKKLTITCLPDAFDNRIGTLLELYRDITWSWVHKKEIIPANLRKFDMAVYIFETPEKTWHNDDSTINQNTKTESSITNNLVSYKMLEFHDCEFNYNSVKNAWSDIDNTTGIQPTYTIDITYNDCYEVAYNDIMMRTIGDVILTDLYEQESKPQEDNNSVQFNTYKKSNVYQMELEAMPIADKKEPNNINNNNADRPYKDIRIPSSDNSIAKNIKIKKNIQRPGFIENALNQVVGHAVAGITDWAKQKLMGNIFGFSMTSLIKDAQSLLQGDIIRTGMTIGQYAREQKNNKRDKQLSNSKPTGNIFKNSTIANNL